MLYCKVCGGKLFEGETYKESDEWKIEIGCFVCWRKVYVSLKDWDRFKAKLSIALGYTD